LAREALLRGMELSSHRRPEKHKRRLSGRRLLSLASQNDYVILTPREPIWFR
jgi:hypothetical protein